MHNFFILNKGGGVARGSCAKSCDAVPVAVPVTGEHATGISGQPGQFKVKLFQNQMQKEGQLWSSKKQGVNSQAQDAENGKEKGRG